MATFESYARRIDKINACLAQYGIDDLDQAQELCLSKGIDCTKIVRSIQPIAFDNAGWAYTLGTAIALKKGCRTASAAASASGFTSRHSRVSMTSCVRAR